MDSGRGRSRGMSGGNEGNEWRVSGERGGQLLGGGKEEEEDEKKEAE